MLAHPPQPSFVSINPGYDSTFKWGQLSLGLVVPLESYPHGPVPSMTRHIERVQLAESLGFRAVWLRDVPFDVPAFGDAGQPYDPFVYLGTLAAQTETIALGVASLILPLRHPAHVAKAAASVDVLSAGRLVLGVASGDRPQEYPAMSASFGERGAAFRSAYTYIREMAQTRPRLDTQWGTTAGDMDLLPKPAFGRLPLLITGGSQQDPQWIAKHGDGWMTYPRDPAVQQRVISSWRDRVEALGRPPQPLMQPLYVDVAQDPNAPAEPIHLGLRSGIVALREHLERLRAIGVNHVALNLRFNRAPIEATLRSLAENLLPTFQP